jgi:flagellar biosynthesis regulator FlbT
MYILQRRPLSYWQKLNVIIIIIEPSRNNKFTEVFKHEICILLFFSTNEIVRPCIKLSSCLESFVQSEIIEQFFNTALNQRTTAQKYVIFT